MTSDEVPPTEIAGTGRAAGIGAARAVTEVKLRKEADREGLSVDDQIKQREADLREWMANRIVPAFLRANGLTLAALGLLWFADEVNIVLSIVFHVTTPVSRVITSGVVMTLLGATTVQVGAVAAVIARYLFPGRA